MNEYLVTAMGSGVKVKAGRATVALVRGVDFISTRAKKLGLPGSDVTSKCPGGLSVNVSFLRIVPKGEKA